uniref:uncharacterized protein LOC122591597 n=1 Tax=Erigeron canadensis TaxID=72917 RepID=UPI001CB8C293|nr:uncharacterized protein LOC122591597 [Erigeron canadensis]
MSTSMWFDNWCQDSPLIQHVSPRAIANAGFSLKDNVSDMLSNGQWKFPVAWYDLFPVLINIPLAQIQDGNDSITWCDRYGVEADFSASRVWDSIRHRSDVIPWVNLVWVPQCIPTHAFHLWLVMRNKLKTQDQMKRWDVGSETNLMLMCCSLCQHGLDSHSHLFFEYYYSVQVWNEVRSLVGLQNLPNIWDSIAGWLIVQPQKSGQVTIAKLLVAATSYFVWQERNSWLFTTTRRTPSELAEVIKYTVRLKLMSMRFKATVSVQGLMAQWQLPNELTLEDG